MARSVTAREKKFLAAAGLVALFIVGRWLVVPFVGSEAGIAGLIEDKLAVLKSYQNVVARERLLRQEEGELDGALDSYRTFLLPSDTPPLAAAALETRLGDLADRAGIRIVSKKILPHRTRDSFVEIPVQIVAAGTVANVRDFIVFLESAEIFIAVQEMNLSATTRRQVARGGRTPAGQGDIQATITVAGVIPS